MFVSGSYLGIEFNEFNEINPIESLSFDIGYNVFITKIYSSNSFSLCLLNNSNLILCFFNINYIIDNKKYSYIDIFDLFINCSLENKSLPSEINIDKINIKRIKEHDDNIVIILEDTFMYKCFIVGNYNNNHYSTLNELTCVSYIINKVIRDIENLSNINISNIVVDIILNEDSCIVSLNNTIILIKSVIKLKEFNYWNNKDIKEDITNNCLYISDDKNIYIKLVKEVNLITDIKKFLNYKNNIESNDDLMFVFDSILIKTYY